MIKENFEKDGFVIVKGLLQRADVNATVESIKHHFDLQLSRLGQPVPNECYLSMRALYAYDLTAYSRTISALWRSVSVYNLLHDNSIQLMLKNQFGFSDLSVAGGQVVHVQSESLRIPNGYFGLPPHQDFPSVNGSLDGVIIWVPLVDVNRDNYPLEVLPGSHKKGIYPYAKNVTSTGEISSSSYNTNDFYPVECQIGDVVVMSLFTVHRSSVVGKDKLKLACSTRFNNISDSYFKENIYPSAYIRSVDREQFKDTIPDSFFTNVDDKEL